MAAVRYSGSLPTGGAVEFEVENGVITSVTPVKDSPALPWIMPVLVDLQQNGAMGYTFSTLKKAEDLWRQNPDLPVGEIANCVGISDPHYFSRLYRKERGITPKEFKNRL